jgi:hypothetical protein
MLKRTVHRSRPIVGGPCCLYLQHTLLPRKWREQVLYCNYGKISWTYKLKPKFMPFASPTCIQFIHNHTETFSQMLLFFVSIMTSHYSVIIITPVKTRESCIIDSYRLNTDVLTQSKLDVWNVNCISHGLCCSASADALSCAQDIIDTSCKPEEGRNYFDAWIQGLQGIYSSVCEANFDKLKSNSV